MEENIRASLAGMESIYELTRVVIEKDKGFKEKEHIGSLLRSALSKRMTSNPSTKTNELFQVAENGLREAGIDFKCSKHIGGRFPTSNDKMDAHETEDEIYNLESQLEIIELHHSVEELR
ncbi:hypothetical protein FEM48_Zijuj10G0054200 [Ziziphus jujuba var. spinosa]|uniref:Uncharacterized protein n=1 Tax=Ziziphus jujuba var. spinosa TaxID=714518 RepID=A0A978ULJ7_ZIZJJ|nr:hypothetical protein FEM48_Zijuj10G0054200 [Ziziphus jujuba var. spinosa]